MNKSFRLFALFVCAASGLLIADDFKSQFIGSGGECSSCPIHVDDEQFLLIRNFTQDGGTTRGTVTFSRHNSTPVPVLTASIVDPAATPGALEVINSIVIAGPATVDVSCGDGNTGCFFTYKKDHN